MLTITYLHRTVSVPTCIEELTAQQYERYLLLAVALSSGAFDIDTARVKLTSMLLGLQYDYTMLVPKAISEIEAQTGALNHFFEEGKLSLSTPKNMLPEYDGYHGPADWLEGLRFGTFVEIMAIIDSLRGATDEEVEQSYSSIARLLYGIPKDSPAPPVLTIHAPLLFMSVWKLIQSQPLHINGGLIDFRILFQHSGGTTRPNDHTGWDGVTFEVAKEGVFGAVKDVEECDMWKVLLYLYKCKFEYINEQKASVK